jgi:osmotically-inducible protein OsmY
MAHDDRQHYRQHSGRREGYRSEPSDYRGREQWRPGEDRDPYRAGEETRYMADWRDRSERRTFEGGRSYPVSGYPEEFGYGRSARPEAEHRPREVGSSYRRSGAYGQMRWGEHEDTPDYYGTGSHYGGGYGTAPSTRTSGSGSWGATGYAGQGAWSEDQDWLPEDERATTGEYASYGRSTYGAQSGYGRDYGSSYGRSAAEMRQDYRGRGPKGYSRSDERLKEIICERLTDDPRIDASDVTVEVQQGVVKLTGAVPERRTKYQIEDLIERCGAQDVDNQLRIKSSPLWSGADAGAESSATSGARQSEGRSTSAASATKRS